MSCLDFLKCEMSTRCSNELSSLSAGAMTESRPLTQRLAHHHQELGLGLELPHDVLVLGEALHEPGHQQLLLLVPGAQHGGRHRPHGVTLGGQLSKTSGRHQIMSQLKH